MSPDQIFRIGPLRFDALSGELAAPAESRRLEPRAAAVLALLCARPGQMVARQALLDQCWGEGEGSDEALTQAVAQIRRTFQELGAPADLIETLAKRGYRLNGGNAGPGLAAETRPATINRTLIAAAVALLAILALLLVAPHQLRHNIRHAVGLGPSAH